MVRSMLKTQGVLSLYRGFVPTVAREMPGYFAFFGSYELTRSLLTPAGKTKDEIGNSFFSLFFFMQVLTRLRQVRSER